MMGAVVENSTPKSAPVLSTCSALIKTASGKYTPESVAGLASSLAGKSRVLLPGREVPRVDTRRVVREDHKAVVKVSRPHFFSF